MVLLVAVPVFAFTYLQLTGVVATSEYIIAIAVLSFLLAVFFSHFLAKSIADPVNIIISSVQKAKSKKSKISINDYTTDEIADLASELNQMSTSLHKELRTLGKKTFESIQQTEHNQQQVLIYESRIKLLQTCLQVSRQLNTTFDFKTNIVTILDEVTKTLNVQWASILLLDRKNHEMTVASIRGVEKSLVDEVKIEQNPSIKLKPDEGLAGLVIKEGLPLIANKGYKDPRFKQFSEFKNPDSRIASLLCAPIKGSDSSVLGVMNLVNRISPPVFRTEDLSVVEDFCTLASLVIERNNIYKELFCDKKTGLFALNIWKNCLKEEAVRARRYAQTLSVVIVKVDSFDKVVSRTDAAFGEKIIATIAKKLTSLLRDTDYAAGLKDRFYILLPSTDNKGALFLTGRLKELLEDEAFNYKSHKFKISLSVGIAGYPDSAVEQLEHNAQHALDSALAKGGGRAVIYKSQDI